MPTTFHNLIYNKQNWKEKKEVNFIWSLGQQDYPATNCIAEYQFWETQNLLITCLKNVQIGMVKT